MLKKLNITFSSGNRSSLLLLPAITVVVGGLVGAVIATVFLSGPSIEQESPKAVAANQPGEIPPTIATKTPETGEKPEVNESAEAAETSDIAETPEVDETAEAASTQPLEEAAEVTVASYTVPAIDTAQEMTKTVSVGKGDTLIKVLTRAGAGQTESHQAITALNELFDPRSLKIGQDVTLYFDAPENTQEGTSNLVRVSLKEDVDRQLAAVRTPGAGFTAQETVLDLDKKMVRAGGVIQSSLFLSAAQAGIPTKTIVDLIRIFSYDVDFQREIQPGDSFEVYFERFSDENGDILKDGAIHWASMTLSGKKISLYRFKTDDDGFTDYYDEQGRSVKKTLMRTPIDGARLTSGFGKRKHPVLGYTKMHRGVDFGARRGTPIMAAGNGVIERASRYGSFGNYVLIRHNNEYETAYAHMKKFAKGIHKGARVKQGQIIGYVGTTGRSTGPHLHYEVHKNNRQINPLSVKLPAGRKLAGKMLTAFNAYADEVRKEVTGVDLETKLAKLSD